MAPILTLVLLVAALAAGWWRPPLPRAAPWIVVGWAVLMPVLFVDNDVGDDGDVGAFVFAALVVLGLALGLTWAGSWLRARNRPA